MFTATSFTMSLHIFVFPRHPCFRSVNIHNIYIYMFFICFTFLFKLSLALSNNFLIFPFVFTHSLFLHVFFLQFDPYTFALYDHIISIYLFHTSYSFKPYSITTHSFLVFPQLLLRIPFPLHSFIFLIKDWVSYVYSLHRLVQPYN